jgi:hypothetical protein
MLTTGITEMQGEYHPTGAFIIPDGSESFIMYCSSLAALEIAAHTLIADVQPSDKAGCKTCSVGLGRGRSGVIRNVYYSDRPLPPGHDPGPDSGEDPNGLQRGSRPLDILVECRGHLRPRREMCTRCEDHPIVMLTIDGDRDPRSLLSRLPWRSRGGCRCHGHDDHGGPCPPRGACRKLARSRRSRRPRWPHAPGARDESSPSYGGHGRHDDHGGHDASDADADDHGGHGGAVPAERATCRSRVTARSRRSQRSQLEPASQRIGDPKRGWPG